MRKTAPQVTKRQEYSITRANNVHKVDSQFCGISINAKCGRIALAVNMFLRMVQERSTACAPAVRLEHFLVRPMHLLAKDGKIVQQAK